MISRHFISKILQKTNFILTVDQELLLDKIAEFCLNIGSKNREAFIIKGYAGTGKTTIISILIEALNEIGIKTVLLAPTGRAAKVFGNISGKSAFTIHKKIYRQKSSKDGFGKFVLNKNLHTNTLFIIDEASMISNSQADASLFGSGKLLDDIINYVFEAKNCKLIFLGDVAQLPPVGLSISPALDSKFIESYGIGVTQVVLKEVVRQKKESNILKNATIIRKNISNENLVIPSITANDNTDVHRINGNDLIEFISDNYDKSGLSETIIVCRSNKRANKYNEGIRNSILWHEEEIATGDLMMVVKNNYYWVEDINELEFIANGDIFEIIRIKKYEERYGHRFANITARFSDHNNVEVDLKIFLDSIYIDKASFSQEENRELYQNVLEDYIHITNKKKQFEQIRNNECFNALQVKFAYAITCHKAQGGQWKNVFVDQGYFKDDMINLEYLRWLYTAITRATEKLYLINFPKEFYE